MLAVVPDERGHLVGAGDDGERVGHRQPQLPQGSVGLALRGELSPLDGPDPVDQHPQRPRRADGGILLPQGSRGRVAGVGEGRLAGLHEAVVERLEAGDGEEHLSAHLQHGRRVPREPVRDAVDRQHVGRDVLPDPSVAAGGRDAQAPVQVEQVDREAVDLELAQVALGRRPGQPGGELLVGEHVVKAQQPAPVGHRLEVGDQGRADALGDRVRGDQRGVLSLQRLEFAHGRVVVGVGHRGRVRPVVRLLRIAEQLVQLGPAPPQVRGRHAGFGLDVLGHVAMVPHRSTAPSSDSEPEIPRHGADAHQNGRETRPAGPGRRRADE